MSATATIQIGGKGYIVPNVFTASAAPTATNDTADGKNIGDIIVNTTTGIAYLCTANGAGVAKWQELENSNAVSVTFSPASGSANVCQLTIQAVDQNGVAFAGVVNLDVLLSDASSGAGLTATTASGTVVAGANGADLGDYTAKKAKRVQTDATGKYILAITDTAKTHFFPVVFIDGKVVVGAQLLTANYG